MKRLLIFATLVMVPAACSHILGLRPPGRAPYPHRTHVLEGISCIRCHDGITEAGEDGPLHLPKTQRCLECHEEPHDRRRCRNCHGEVGEDIRVAEAKHHLRFEHRLHLASVSGNCVRCHQDVKAGSESLLPKMASCLSCHEHRESFTLADCNGCHIDLLDERLRPLSHLAHEEDYVERHRTEAAGNQALCETCHTQSQCAGCHGVNAPILPARRDLGRRTLAGLHRAGFRSRHGREASADGGLCMTCHTEQSCLECHASVGLAADNRAAFNPHPPGWVSASPGGNAHGPAARRDPVQCASCHGGAGEQLCVQCHRVGGVGGSVHPPGFESPRNPTKEQPCRMCHQ